MKRATVVNLRKVDKNDPDVVYIGRPSKWGNPFKIGPTMDRSQVIELFEIYFRDHPELMEAARQELAGKKLACYCHPKACHGDVLAGFVNSLVYEERTEE